MKNSQDILDWSDTEIMSEILAIKYLFKQKEVMRWNVERDEPYKTESVAEHIYGLQVLANYFLVLEDREQKLNVRKIMNMILWHDADEIETGDILTHKKTSKDRDAANVALLEFQKKIPTLLSGEINVLMREYAEQKTRESKFVRALDKIEPEFHIVDEAGGELLVQHMKFTKEEFDTLYDKVGYVLEDFPYMQKFHGVTKKYREENKFFIENE